MIEADDDDDDEPIYRIRYKNNELTDNKCGYWEQYDILKKCWFRLCDKCLENVRKPEESLCVYHFNEERRRRRGKKKTRIKNVKKSSKRLDTKIKGKRKKQIKLPPAIQINTIEEQVTIGIQEERTKESLPIVISVSSSLNKQQIAYIKEFITKFHNESQSIEFACSSQPDYVDSSTTHLITNDSGSFTTLLTKQIIQACVRHIFVSSINWILRSLEQSSVIDHFPYEILREKQTLKDSRGIKQCRFDQLPVFPSSCIMSVECHKGITQMKMTREELIEIVELSGATLYDDYVYYKTLIILCNSRAEVVSRKKQNGDNLSMINEKVMYYCKPAFLFDSIVRHEVQSIEAYLW